MKKVIKFCSWAIIVALCAGLSSCSKDDDVKNEDALIVGVWIFVEGDGTEPCYQGTWMEFESDGTYTEYFSCNNKLFTGT
jgi:hypothetical protein